MIDGNVDVDRLKFYNELIIQWIFITVSIYSGRKCVDLADVGEMLFYIFHSKIIIFYK